MEHLALEQVEETIKKFNLLKINDRIVIAVSGGPDSVALVYLLNRLKKKWRLYLHLAHLNHLLRKDEADADSLFVENLAKKLNLPLSCASVKVSDFAKEAKISLEEAARQVRYDFLLRVAKENSATKIALGHNRNDQAETVLMRFLRGSGISGLRGIPPKRALNGCLIIRPLIDLNREQILQFLLAKDIPYRSDSSNFENLFLRNRVRNELLPFLQKNFNPNLSEILVNFGQNIAEDYDLLQQLGEAKFRTVCLKNTKLEIIIELKKLLKLHKALQKFVVRLAIKELKGDVRSIDYRHWKEIEDLILNRPQGSIVDLPKRLSVLHKKEELIFFKRGHQHQADSCFRIKILPKL